MGIPPYFLYQFSLISYVFINIHKYSKQMVSIFYHFGQMVMSQILFGNQYCGIR